MKRPNFRAQMKAIRPFVRFNYKNADRASAKAKRKISAYYDFIQSNKGRYAPLPVPKGAKFEKVQADLNPQFRSIARKVAKTEFKRIFVPTSDASSRVVFDKKTKRYVLEEKPARRKRRTVKRGKKKAKKKKVKRRRKGFINFSDRVAFALDPRGYVEGLIDGFPKNAQFRVVNKDRSWVSPGHFDVGSIGDEIVGLDSDSGEVEGYVLGLEYSY